MTPSTLCDDMKSAMRRLGSTVSVITAFCGATRHAMTATSITSLSMDPPSLLVCVNQATGMYKALSAVSEFCVNILSAEQRHVAAACGGRLKGDSRFLEGECITLTNGIPVLANAQAILLCERDGMHIYGTHTIFIGRVRQITRHRGMVNPLVYLNGGYFEARALATDAPDEINTALAAALPLDIPRVAL